MLVLLVLSMLGTLVWLASRYEISQVQEQLDRDGVDAVNDIRAGLQRNVQALQTLVSLPTQDPSPAAWSREAAELLRGHREWVRIERRDTDLQVQGPVVAEFQKLFLATWQAQQGQPLAQLHPDGLRIIGKPHADVDEGDHLPRDVIDE